MALVDVSLPCFLNNQTNHRTTCSTSSFFEVFNAANLLVIKDKIIENIEHKLYTFGLFLDFRKAFDCVQHEILLQKLNYYGVRGITLNLVKDYLRHRIQYVRVNDITSNQLTVTCEVPQGSIL